MSRKQRGTQTFRAAAVVLLGLICISFIVPSDFWISSVAMDVYKIVFNAVCVAAIGSALVYWNNTIMSKRREVYEMETAERNVQREIHLKRKDHLATAITKLLQMRQLIFYAFTSFQKRDAQFDSLTFVDAKNLAPDRQREYVAHQKQVDLFEASVAKLEILRGELIVAAELYGDFPPGVQLTPNCLTPYMIEGVVRPIIQRVSDSDHEAVQTLDHLILNIIEDLRVLVRAEEVLAKQSLNAKVSYEAPLLQTLAEIESTPIEAVPAAKLLPLETIGVRRPAS